MSKLQQLITGQGAPDTAEEKAPDVIRVAFGVRGLDDTRAILGLDGASDLIQVKTQAATMTELYDAAMTHDIDVVIFTPQLPGFERGGGELIRKLRDNPGHPIVAIAVLPPDSGDWPRTLEQVGVAAHVASPLCDEEVRHLAEIIPEKVRQAYQARKSATFIPRLDPRIAQVAAGVARHQTIAAWGPKGGSGKTFVAVNLACLFGVVANRPTILVDADTDSAGLFVQLGHTAGNFGHTIYHLAAEYAQGNGRLTPSMVESYLTPYQGSLKVMMGVFNSVEGGAPHLIGERGFSFMTDLVSILQDMADFVILDLGLSCAHAIHLAALSKATMVFLMVNCTNADEGAFRTWAHQEPLQNDMELDPKRFKLVFTAYADDLDVDRKGIIDTIGLPEFAMIPQDVENEVGRSINRHTPVVLGEPRREVSRRLAGIATQIYPPLDVIWSAYTGRGTGDGFSWRRWFRR